jgi:AICAR transformylase/IMP cyclohydrolase PurH/REP element-mobilizing transposase RayT
MSEPVRIRRALISVYDKTGIVEFARALHEEFGIELISTGGTAKVLKDAGLPVTLVEEITGFPEMLDGRVKTLHPKIHAAILADRDNPEHMRQLAEQGIAPIDIVVVNLYPFEQTIAKPGCTFEETIEMIDIGGPCLLRAAAKNHRHVLVVTASTEYGSVLGSLRRWGDDRVREDALRSGAFGAFWATTAYDATISTWLSLNQNDMLPDVRVLRLWNWGRLRYGENPHQTGELLGKYEGRGEFDLTAADTVLDEPQQAEMSFNNYMDANAALELCAELTRAGIPGDGSAKLYFAQPGESPAKHSFALPPDDDLQGSAKLYFAQAAQPQAAHVRPASDELTYRRKLPHWQIAGATYFVTFSTASGELSERERDIVLEALRYWDGQKLDLHAAVVMREHVHLLVTARHIAPDHPERYNLTELLQSIKANSARSINRLRGRRGQVWLRESYDRWMRTAEEFLEKWRYIADNPVKEGLALTPEAYRWWYANETLGAFDEGPSESRGKHGDGVGGKQPRSGKEGLCPAGREPLRSGEEHLRPTGEEHLRRTARAAVCFIKHTNACGAATATDPIEAYRCAYLGDPNAAMGGILAVNFNVDAPFAEAVMETYQRWGKTAGAGSFFVEVWLAPSFDDDAVRIIRGEVEGAPQKDWGKRVRLLAVGDMSAPPDPNEMDFKRIAGGMLMQTRDLVGLNEEQWKVVTRRRPTETEMNDLRLAWLICKHTKSNAITVCRDGTLIGNGAGQMSRVMSCRIATWLAKENGHAESLKGAAAASDAFFPFRDGPDILMDAGVTALIQPGGGKRDQEVIDACNARGVAMIFTGTRHFKH